MRLIDADALHDALRKEQRWIVHKDGYVNEGYSYDQVHFSIDKQPTVEAIPIKWMIKQAENPSNSDAIRNALDHIVYALWAEREEE